jgi:hypothetical protein
MYTGDINDLLAYAAANGPVNSHVHCSSLTGAALTLHVRIDAEGGWRTHYYRF